MQQLVFLSLLFGLATAQLPDFVFGGPRCEAIIPRFDACAHYGYNSTLVPNGLGHRTQSDAHTGYGNFAALLFFKPLCHADLQFFLCTIHAPFCAEVERNAFGVPPCRELCERVRRGCSKVMAQKVKWEDSYGGKLVCSRFPSEAAGEVCMPSPSSKNAPPSPPPSTSSPVVEEETTTGAPAEKVTTLPKPQTTSPPQPDKPVVPSPHSSKKCPKCPRTVRPTYKNFMKGKYDFVIRGIVEERVRSDGKWTYKLRLHQIYNQSRVSLVGSLSKTLSLWTKASSSDSKCACPKLRPNRKYLIAGHEDAKLGRLEVNKRTLIAKWSDNVGISAIKWFKRAARKVGATAFNFVPPLPEKKKGGKTRGDFRKTLPVV